MYRKFQNQIADAEAEIERRNLIEGDLKAKITPHVVQIADLKAEIERLNIVIADLTA